MKYYTINKHKHHFAAWAAGRAAMGGANSIGCSFTVEQGKKILEKAKLNHVAKRIENLPAPDNFDRKHLEWRKAIISFAKEEGINFGKKHGVAAKLINVYLKSIYVCSNNHDHKKVKAIHPPIDSVLLNALYKQNIGGKCSDWQAARRVRWSNLDSDQYQNLISAIKDVVPKGKGLWKIEKYWQGHQ